MLNVLELDSLEIDNIGSWPLWVRQACIVFFCIGILGLAYYYDMNTQWEQYVSMKENRSMQQDIFVEKQAQVKHLDIYKQQMRTIRETFEILKHQLPQSKEEAGFLEAISQHASAAGLIFLSIKPSPEEHKEFYMEYPLEIKLCGSYHGIGSFMSQIASMPRMVTLHDFSIKTDKPEKAMFGTVEITLVAKTYSIEKS